MITLEKLLPVLALFALGCEPQPEVHVATAIDSQEQTSGAGARLNLPLRPLPAAHNVDPGLAAIGGKLFADASLSADGTVSCATCHPLDRAGADGLMHSRGVNGIETPVNTPTVYNVSFNFRFNWDGAYSALEEALDAPIARTMGTTWAEIEAKLRADPASRQAFSSSYSDGLTVANVKDALARYLETLITPNSRFDMYMRGDMDALSTEEQRGLETFLELGCASCHQGANIGGNLFQRLGVMHDYFEERVEIGGPPISDADMGLFRRTQRAQDRHVFRVPSLRNVALTPPYFHDGSVATLELAVTKMGYVQLGRKLSAEQVTLVVGFLKTLTGLPLPTEKSR